MNRACDADDRFAVVGVAAFAPSSAITLVIALGALGRLIAIGGDAMPRRSLVKTDPATTLHNGAVQSGRRRV
ncbi:MAG TPA: hypothetical protein VFU81_16885, partial [Thermomicrobiales bacterium]|nr:hypothetical protein [Thermomicrobiales bacterium]